MHTYNTCSLDSLFQIYVALYAAYESIKNQIEEIENSDFCDMIRSAFNTNGRAITNLKDLYEKRDNMMQILYNENLVSTGQGLVSIDCNSNIDYTIEHVLPKELFSYIRKKTCNRCGEVIV